MKSSLAKYSKKRDFKKTPEPNGTTVNYSRQSSKKLRFVVQEHHARRLHWDFRLEWEGVLKSWAVPKGPSLDPKDKRLAVETEDHPLNYGSFEGEIPKGEYGAGEVMIWDKGEWIPEKDPKAGFKQGHLEFSLKGDRLQGKFILVRTRRGKDWLLIKRSDDFVAPTAPRETKPEKMPDFIPVQLAQLTEKPPEGAHWLHEIKFDGYRVQAHIKSRKVKLYTRSGLDWTTKFSTLAKELKKLPVKSAILDGEAVVLDEHGVSDFQLLQNALKTEKEDLHYFIFDLLYLNGRDLQSLPLIERKKKLEKILKKSDHIHFSSHIIGHANELIASACDRKIEGLVSKNMEDPYSSGRSNSWQKVKCTERQEFVIGGYTPGRGSRGQVGALLLGLYNEEGNLDYCGKVGTGFTETSLREITNHLKHIETEESPFTGRAAKERRATWVKPTLVVEISFANWTSDGRLRAPVFHGLREDKKPKEIHLETTKPKDAPKVSNPDKIFFRKEGVTKKQIADYIQTIAPLMLPYIKDRPLSLVRCPNGTEGHCFFQKHPADLSNLKPLKIKADEAPYVTVDSAEGLVSLVQLGVVEIHTWNSRAPKVERPDQIVIDFDPGPGVSFSTVKAACFELRDLLKQLKLKSFPKATGGKGLHVHIPIAAHYSWDEVKAFAQSLARAMVANRPELYTATMTKSKRSGKIFVDYLRNGDGATAIAPFSLRRKFETSVAIPITWQELQKLPRPDFFDLKKALKRTKNYKDPWPGYSGLKQEIAVLEQLQQAA